MINFLVQIYNVNIYICYRCIFYLKFLYHKILNILKYSFLYVFIKLVLANILSISNFIFRISAVLILSICLIVSLVFLVNYIKESHYYSTKYDKILSEGFRSKLTNIGDDYFEERGLIQNIFGEGFSSYTTNLGNTAPEMKLSKGIYKDWLLVETDYYDFLGAFGITLSLLLFSFYILYFLFAILNYYNSRSAYQISILLIYTMALIHGFKAGHVFYSPTVLGVLAIFIYLINSYYYKKIE